MKKILVLLMAITMIMSMVGCQSTDKDVDTKSSNNDKDTAVTEVETEEDVEDDERYVAVIMKSFAGDFWKTVELGALQAGEDLGVKVTVEGADTESNIEQQIKMVENAVLKQADAIAIAVLDSEGLVPAVNAAADKGVIMLTFNGLLNSDRITTHVATDNWAAGEMAGEALVEATGGKGKVAIIGAAEGVKNNRDRSDGAASIIAKYPDMEVVSIQYAENDLNKTISIANDIMSANPDLVGFFSNNETTTVGVATALKEKGLDGKMVHIGFDASAQTIAQVQEGVTAGFVTQDPFNMGYLAVVKAIEALDGKELDDYFDTGAQYVTMENIDDPSIHKVLYPFE